MEAKLGFGKAEMTVNIPDENIIGILLPNKLEVDRYGEAELCRALRAPIGAPLLTEIVHAGDTVVIITSDITRPCPTSKIMPALLDELYDAGIRPEDITLVFALGSHRRHTEEEKRRLAGERAYREIRCEDSNPDDCIHFGVTSRGTPVDITKTVARADRRICLGNIEFHYFAGYSGGGKAIMPGVSTREAIQKNHSMMTEPKACAGNLETNPLRLDIEEAAAMCGVDYIVNVVLDEHKRIIRAVAGDVVAAHRIGCQFLDQLYKKDIPRLADIVLVSQGGAPKDINLYQTQKALDNAKYAVKSGGIVILVGSCREGFGEITFEQWMLEAEAPGDLIKRISAEFKLGGHKAAAIALVLELADIYLVSEMGGELVNKIFFKPYSTAQAALDAAFERLGPKASVIIMPFGGSTLPYLRQKEGEA